MALDVEKEDGIYKSSMQRITKVLGAADLFVFAL